MLWEAKLKMGELVVSYAAIFFFGWFAALAVNTTQRIRHQQRLQPCKLSRHLVGSLWQVPSVHSCQSMFLLEQHRFTPESIRAEICSHEHRQIIGVQHNPMMHYVRRSSITCSVFRYSDGTSNTQVLQLLPSVVIDMSTSSPSQRDLCKMSDMLDVPTYYFFVDRRTEPLRQVHLHYMSAFQTRLDKYLGNVLPLEHINAFGCWQVETNPLQSQPGDYSCFSLYTQYQLLPLLILSQAICIRLEVESCFTSAARFIVQT